jgi:hypothetical protein
MVIIKKLEFHIPFTDNISFSNPLESKTVLYCTIRIVKLRFVQYKTVFDSRGLEQDITLPSK